MENVENVENVSCIEKVLDSEEEKQEEKGFVLVNNPKIKEITDTDEESILKEKTKKVTFNKEISVSLIKDLLI